MNVPDRKKGEALLNEAEQMNPGKWAEHCRYAAKAAEIIAARTRELDPNAAYVMGLLHDVGRRVGVCGLRHVTEGYRWMNELGFSDSARICYTHSFPTKEVDSIMGKNDCGREEYDELKGYLMNVEYDDYDRLIQLCDAVCAAEGFCIVEKRLFDVALRYGFNDYCEEKWKKTLSLKEYFDEKAGCNIYSILPGIEAVTFGAL